MATITSIIFHSKVIVSYYNLITQFQELSLFFKGNKILDFYTVLEVFVFFPGNVRVSSVQVSIATSLFLQIRSYKCLWDDSIKWEKCAWDNSTVLLWMYMRRLSKLEYYTKTPKNSTNKQIVFQRPQSEMYFTEADFERNWKAGEVRWCP